MEMMNLSAWVLLNDGDIIVMGISRSGSSGEKTDSNTGNWVLKINSEGDLLWEKTLSVFPRSSKTIVVNDENQVMFAGYGKVNAMDADGNIMFTQPYDSYRIAESMVILPSGELVIANFGEIIKLDAQGNTISSAILSGRGTAFYYPDGGVGFARELKKYPFDTWNLDWMYQKYSIDGEFLFEEVIPDQNNVEYRSIGAELDEVITLDDGGLLFYARLQTSLSLVRTNSTSLRSYLVDAQNNIQLQELNKNQVIDPNELEADSFAFVIKSGLLGTGRLDVELDGPVKVSKSFNNPPYVLFGDGADFTGTALPNGNYTLSATSYCGQASTTGVTKVFNFTIERTLDFEFTLVDADTEIDVHAIQSNDVIDFGQIGNDRLSIRVDVGNNNKPKPDSVKLILNNGFNPYERIERFVPYALYGGYPANNYYGRNFCPGDYTIEAIAYFEGDAIHSEPVPFQLVGGDALTTTLTLVNATTNEDIEPLGAEVALLSDGLSIRADVGNCAQSVHFVLKDQSGQILLDRIENITPYALLGDAPRWDYISWLPKAGDYVLEVTAYTQDEGMGVVGTTQIVSFSVLESLATDIDEETTDVELYPNPSGSEQLHISLKNPVSQVVQVKVMDKQGRVIIQKTANTQEFDLNLNNLKTGYYIVEIVTSDEIMRETLIRY